MESEVLKKIKRRLKAILKGREPFDEDEFGSGAVWHHPEVKKVLGQILDEADEAEKEASKVLESGKEKLTNFNKSDHDDSRLVFFKIEDCKTFTPLKKKRTFNLEDIPAMRHQNRSDNELLNRGFPTTKEEQELLVEMFLDGKSFKQMQDFFQRSEITLRYLLEDSNVDLRYCEICDDIIPQGRVNAIPETRSVLPMPSPDQRVKKIGQ